MWTLITFLFFTGLVGLASWWITRKDDRSTSDGFFLGGRSLTWYFIGGSLLLTNISTEQLVGLNGGGFEFGMVVMAWEVIAAVAMVFMALFMLRHYLVRGITTLPEFLEQRFDKRMRDLLTGLALFQMMFLVMPFVLYSGALALNAIFGTEERLGLSGDQALWLMVVLIGVVGSIYAIGGGLRAVAVSDTLNGIGLLLGGLLVPAFGIYALGEGSFGNGLRALGEARPEILNPVGGSDSNVPFSTLFTGMIFINVSYWCTTQFIIQRTFAARSLSEGQKGILFAALMKLFGPLYLVLPGIIALQYFAGGLEHSDHAYPALVQAVLPGWMAGFFGAVLFGAVLSSFNSTLNSAATIFSLNIYKPIKPDASQREMVYAGRIFGVVVAVAAVLAAPMVAGSAEGMFTLMKKLGSVFCAMPAIILVGMFNRSVPAIAAKVALFLGIVLYVLLEYVLGGDFGGFQVHWLHLLVVSAGIPTAVMLVWGWVSPRAAPEVQVEPPAGLDLIPWKLAWPAGLAICAGVFLIYYGLWRFAGG